MSNKNHGKLRQVVASSKDLQIFNNSGRFRHVLAGTKTPQKKEYNFK